MGRPKGCVASIKYRHSGSQSYASLPWHWDKGIVGLCTCEELRRRNGILLNSEGIRRGELGERGSHERSRPGFGCWFPKVTAVCVCVSVCVGGWRGGGGMITQFIGSPMRAGVLPDGAQLPGSRQVTAGQGNKMN